MAKKTSPVSRQPKRLVGMDKIVSIFSDAYLIVHSGGAYNLSFFQGQFEPTTVGQDRPIRLQATDYVCVARISLSESSFDKLLKAMQDNKEANKPTKAKERQ